MQDGESSNEAKQGENIKAIGADELREMVRGILGAEIDVIRKLVKRADVAEDKTQARFELCESRAKDRFEIWYLKASQEVDALNRIADALMRKPTVGPCSTCAFWQPEWPDRRDISSGHCVRRAVTTDGFPRSRHDDECAEHEPLSQAAP